MRITFKAKVHDVSGRPLIDVPVLKRHHVDMESARRHPKYGGIANSDLLPNALRKIRRDLFGDGGILWADRCPAGVTVDMTGFLAVVTIEV